MSGLSRVALRRLAAALLLLAPSGAAAQRVLTDADVAPIPWGAQDTKARGLAAQGRCADAVRLADGPAPEVRLARAWLHACARDPAGVVAQTDGLAAALPAGAALARSLRAEALLTLDRPLEALEALGGSESPEGRRLRARALREAGFLDLAASAYEALVQSPGREDRALGLLGAARLALDLAEKGFATSTAAPAGALPGPVRAPSNEAEVSALLLRLAGAPAKGPRAGAGHRYEAALLLRRLDAEHPEHWTAATGRKLAAELSAADPALAKAFGERTDEERIVRAERLLNVHRNEEAVSTLEPLAKAALSKELACRAHMTRGKAEKKLRHWDKAKVALGEAVKACRKADSDLAPGALYHWASALERLSFEADAAAAYQDLIDHFPKHTLADDAGFFLLRHALEDKKDWPGARKLAERLVAKFPEGDMTSEAVFFVAAAAIVDDRWSDARAVMRLNEKLPPPVFTDHDGGRAEYWTTRIAQKLKAPRDEVVAGYRKVLQAMPLGWYSLMAYGRLRELDRELARQVVREVLETAPAGSVPGGTEATWRFPVPASVAPERLDAALLYARLGLAGPAREALGASGEPDPETLWFTAWLLDRAGAYGDSHDILRRKLKEFRSFGPAGPLRRIWHVAFPAPYRELVVQGEKDTGVPAPFLWGIMREESGFTPGVESSANAVGLMQLILPTARRMAKKEDGPIDRFTLTDPALSVRLGARYLAHVLSRAGGTAALPVLPAGYNAGEGALERWLKARGEQPLDLFVETIPFEEARWYTKRVVASYATYRYLYFGGDTDPDPLPYFPLKLPR